MKLTDQQLTDIAAWAEGNLASRAANEIHALVAEVRERRAADDAAFLAGFEAGWNDTGEGDNAEWSNRTTAEWQEAALGALATWKAAQK